MKKISVFLIFILAVAMDLHAQKLYVVDNQAFADLKIYFVDNQAFAGWKNRKKQYLME